MEKTAFPLPLARLPEPVTIYILPERQYRVSIVACMGDRGF